MAEVTFVLREPKSKEKTLIQLILRYGKSRIKLSVNEKILPEYWNKNECRAKRIKKFPTYPEFNRMLDRMENEAKEVFIKFQNDNKGIVPDPGVLKDSVSRKLNLSTHAEAREDLFSFIEKFINESKTRLTHSTFKTYRNAFNSLKSFKEDSKKKVDFDTIDLNFYHNYVNYLKGDRIVKVTQRGGGAINKKYPGMALNSVGKHIKTLKVFLNEAVERELTTNMKFRSKKFAAMSTEVDTIYLNEDELMQIFNLDLSGNKRLERARDLFLVGAFTGLRYSDIVSLTHRHIVNDTFVIKTKKTKTVVEIPVHPVIKSIMKRYENLTDSYLPKKLSNDKLNEYIKEACKKIPGFDETISKTTTKGHDEITLNKPKYELIGVHTARRSFFTNQYNAGMPPHYLMRMSGHTTEKMFFTYIKMKPQEGADAMRKIWESSLHLKVVA